MQKFIILYCLAALFAGCAGSYHEQREREIELDRKKDSIRREELDYQDSREEARKRRQHERRLEAMREENRHRENMVNIERGQKQRSWSGRLDEVPPWNEVAVYFHTLGRTYGKLKRGVEAVKLGDWEKGIENFRAITEAKLVGPRMRLAAHWNLGLAYKYTRQFGKAEEQFKKAFARAPSQMPIFSNPYGKCTAIVRPCIRKQLDEVR